MARLRILTRFEDAPNDRGDFKDAFIIAFKDGKKVKY